MRQRNLLTDHRIDPVKVIQHNRFHGLALNLAGTALMPTFLHPMVINERAPKPAETTISRREIK